MLKENKRKIIFIIFFIVTFILSFLSKYKDGGDDLFYKTASLNYSLFDFVYYRYFNWSGRIIPEFLAYLFNGNLEFLWPLFNSTIITTLSVLIFNYINLITQIKNNKKNLLAIIICISFLLIDKTIINPAFLWKTGSMNYLWPITLGLFSFYPFLLSIKNKLTKKNSLIYLLTILLVSISMEQISLALFLGIFFYIIYMFKNKRRIPKTIYLMSFIFIFGSIILILAPGNQIRIQTETKHNFPEFLSLSLFNRISISLYWVLNKLINFCSLSLSIIYLVVGIKTLKNKNIINSISVISILLGILFLIKNIFKINFEILPITSENLMSFNVLFPYIINIFFLSLIPYLIWRLFKLKNIFLYYFLILFIILLTMLMITFSPTMDVSGNRTLFLPIILLNMLMLELIIKKLKII